MLCPSSKRGFGNPGIKRLWSLAGTLVLLLASGCHQLQRHDSTMPLEQLPNPPWATPTELSKTVLPPYRIEPPDLLRIEVIRLVPKAPYHLKTLDTLNIVAQGTLEEAPIAGVYAVEPGGLVRLGFQYGAVPVAGLTVEQAEQAIDQQLRKYLREPLVTVSLGQTAPLQPIAGEHLVTQDGVVNLGAYGSVPVVGMTLLEAKAAIEAHLSQFLDSPEVLVDVFAYNSKRYYIIMQGAGMGDVVYTFPVTGNETVLDAISQVNGLQSFSSKHIWIARPSPAPGDTQVLPVDWKAVTSLAATETNYQILPGDRLYVAEDKHIALTSFISKVVAPWERVMGFSVLSLGTITRFSGNILQGGGNTQNRF